MVKWERDREPWTVWGRRGSGSEHFGSSVGWVRGLDGTDIHPGEGWPLRCFRLHAEIPAPCPRLAAYMICGVQRVRGNKDGTEVGVPGYDEQTHGHWQGLGKRTSLGEMASMGGVVMHGGVGLGWGWASAPGSSGEELSSGTSAEAGHRAQRLARGH